MLREYLISEAMYALGIPATRALAAVATGEPVYRESVLPGAIFTRVAQSHIRVGTFEFSPAEETMLQSSAWLTTSSLATIPSCRPSVRHRMRRAI